MPSRVHSGKYTFSEHDEAFLTFQLLDLESQTSRCCRDNKRRMTKAAAPPKQIENLAFNLSGFAIQDGIIDRKLYEVICAYEKSKKRSRT